MIPANTLNNNPFLWKTPAIINLSKYPSKCLDNNSIVNFPEEAFFIFSDQRSNSSKFCNVEYPSYPKYYLDVSHLFVKKRKITIRGDVYSIESKPLIDKFKQLLYFNPGLIKQARSVSINASGAKDKSSKKSFSIKIPVYYYFKFEQNYQLIGFLNFKVTHVVDGFGFGKGGDGVGGKKSPSALSVMTKKSASQASIQSAAAMGKILGHFLIFGGFLLILLAAMNEALSGITGKLQFKHYPLKFLNLNELMTDYKKELPRMIERYQPNNQTKSHQKSTKSFKKI